MSSHDPEASHCVGVVEWIGSDGDKKRGLRNFTGSNLQQSLARFFGEMAGDIQQTVFIRIADPAHPLEWNAVAKQLIVQHTCRWTRLRRRLALYFDVYGNLNLPDSLVDLDDLHCAGTGMRLQLASLRPPVCLVVVVDVAEHEVTLGSMDDDPDVLANSHGPEVAIFCSIKPMEL